MSVCDGQTGSALAVAAFAEQNLKKNGLYRSELPIWELLILLSCTAQNPPGLSGGDLQ